MESTVDGIEGVSMISAHNAKIGMSMVEEQLPDLILMDIRLPDMDGFGAFERLKINGKTSSIPVIAITAQATKFEIMRGHHAGFKTYLTKPLNVSKVIKAIKKELDE
jgi:CheY-like chemotaxis protein